MRHLVAAAMMLVPPAVCILFCERDVREDVLYRKCSSDCGHQAGGFAQTWFGGFHGTDEYPPFKLTTGVNPSLNRAKYTRSTDRGKWDSLNANTAMILNDTGATAAIGYTSRELTAESERHERPSAAHARVVVSPVNDNVNKPILIRQFLKPRYLTS